MDGILYILLLLIITISKSFKIPGCMHYFKSVVKNVYEKVIEDEYLQSLSEQQVYFIINNTSRKRLASHGRDPRKLSESQSQQQSMEKIQQIGNVNVDRLFRIFGSDPKLQSVRGKLKQLEQNLEEVTQKMQYNFPRYRKRLLSAINQIDNINIIEKKRMQGQLLRSKLKYLEEASKKSKQITHLNIKLNNIKTLIKMMGEIPNIKKMSLTQLKSINIEQIKSRPNINRLKCLKGLSLFIDKAVGNQLTSVLQKLKVSLVDKFNQSEYENALKDFIIAQHETIKYETLIIKIVQNQIRHIQSLHNQNFQSTCQFYIRFMINLHEVFRWHRLNQKQEKWENLSKGYYGISIQIDNSKITKKIISIMDQCVKDALFQQFYHHENFPNYLRNLYLICRLSQIAYAFSGRYFELTIQQITELVYKKLIKIKERAWSQLQQTFKYEEKNNWNRLPVVDNYSHEPLDRTIYQIFRHKNSQGYSKLLRTIYDSKEMLRERKLLITNPNQLISRNSIECNFWESKWSFTQHQIIQREVHGIKQSENKEQKVPVFDYENNSSPREVQDTLEKEYQQNWQIDSINFNLAQKYQKYKSLVSISQKNLVFKTIISQYSLTILKYIEIYMRYIFYYPIEPVLSISLSTISLIIQNYIYQIFNGFIGPNIKSLFFEKIQNLVSIDQKYHKKRLYYQYPNISRFIFQFKNANKLMTRQQNEQQLSFASPNARNSPGDQYSANNAYMQKQNLYIRSRVVALQSLNYVICYYSHILKIIGLFGSPEKKKEASSLKLFSQSSIVDISKKQLNLSDVYGQIHRKITNKLESYKVIYLQLSEIVYTDCIPKLMNLKITSSLIQSIKWSDDQHTLKQYMNVFSKNCTQFYFKLSSSNRGEVPIHICDRLFGIYWKTQMTASIKTFLQLYKPGKYTGAFVSHPKNNFEKFIDGLYESVSLVVKQKSHLKVPFEKMKIVFAAFMQNSIESTLQILKKSLIKYEFIYAIYPGLLLASESCCYLSVEEIQQKKKSLQGWILQRLVQNAKDFIGPNRTTEGQNLD